MKIRAFITNDIEIDPKEVVINLIKQELGQDGYLSENAKRKEYFICNDEDCGINKDQTKRKKAQITKERYMYILRLLKVKKYLDNKTKTS